MELGAGGRQRGPEATRARLIGAAVSTFANNGYANASVHDICAKAGLSVGSFYYHFTDKAEITVGILERENDGFARRLGAMDLREPSVIESTLSDFLHGPKAPLYRALRDATELEPAVEMAGSELRRGARARLVLTIDRARQKGLIYPVNAPSIAWATLAMIRVALKFPMEEGESAGAIAAILHQLVIAGEKPSG
jgi:AcrR family transcriptional regulator